MSTSPVLLEQQQDTSCRRALTTYNATVKKASPTQPLSPALGPSYCGIDVGSDLCRSSLSCSDRPSYRARSVRTTLGEGMCVIEPRLRASIPIRGVPSHCFRAPTPLIAGTVGWSCLLVARTPPRKRLSLGYWMYASSLRLLPKAMLFELGNLYSSPPHIWKPWIRWRVRRLRAYRRQVPQLSDTSSLNTLQDFPVVEPDLEDPVAVI